MLLDPQQLYELAERQHWAAHAIDLRRDRADWATLAPGHRERLEWHIAAFFAGEERVAVQLGPLIAAARDAGEAAFLTTQQADEARHAQHFDRFYAEIAGRDGSFADRLAAARGDLGAPLLELLDVRLAACARTLAADPGDAGAKVDFVVLYHMVIEGMLALAGQELLLAFLERRAILPGWCEGLRLIARDEHRHIAYGTWLLREQAADPVLRDRIARRLEALVPLAVSVLVPPGARPERFRPLDRTGTEMQRFALDALRRRLAVIGVAG